MSAPRSLSGAKRTSGKLYSTSVSHNHAPSQLPYPRADFLPRSGLVQETLCEPSETPSALLRLLSSVLDFGTGE